MAPVTSSIATEVLAGIDEKTYWMDLLAANDMRLHFDVLKYLTDRRDGRPIQQVRVANPEGEKFQVTVDLTIAKSKLLDELGG